MTDDRTYASMEHAEQAGTGTPVPMPASFDLAFLAWNRKTGARGVPCEIGFSITENLFSPAVMERYDQKRISYMGSFFPVFLFRSPYPAFNLAGIGTGAPVPACSGCSTERLKLRFGGQMVLRVIGIDIGTSLGWSVIEDGRRIDSGQVNLQTDAWEGLGMRVARARQTVAVLLQRHPGAIVGIEQVLHSVQVRATQVWGAILGGVTEACEEAGVGYSFANVTQVKILATGEGNSKKDAMVRAAKARWGVDAGEDEADALFVAALVERRELDPTAPALESLTDQRRREAKARGEAKRAASVARKAEADAEKAQRKAEREARNTKGARRARKEAA